MSTPIGKIEFLVKFDSMEHEFAEALRKAVEHADIDVSGGFGMIDANRLQNIESVCEEALFLIKERLRTPFGRDYRSFLASLGPELTFAKTTEAKQRLTDILMKSPTGQRLYGKMDEKEAEKQAENILNQYIILLEKALDRHFFEKNKHKLINLQNALNQILLGSWKYLSRTFIQQISDKEFRQKELSRILKRGGVEASFAPRKWGVAGKDIEYGGTWVKPPAMRVRTTIKSIDDLIKAIHVTIKQMDLEKLAPSILKRLFGGKPEFGKMEVPSIYGKFLERFFTAYKIGKGTPLPRSMLRFLEQVAPKLFEEVWPAEIRKSGAIKDLFFMITQPVKGRLLEELEKFSQREGFGKGMSKDIQKSLSETGLATLIGNWSEFIKQTELMKELAFEPKYTAEEISKVISEKSIESQKKELMELTNSINYLISKTEDNATKNDLEKIRTILTNLEDLGFSPNVPEEKR